MMANSSHLTSWSATGRVLGLVCLGATVACGQSMEAAADRSPGLAGLVRTLILEEAELKYENSRQWGGTKRVWDGLHIRREGLRIKTKRRWKDARHGTWKRYEAELIDPQRHFHIEISPPRTVEGGAVAVEVTAQGRVRAWARLSEWRRDVQLYSFSADADATVRLWMQCHLSTKLDTSEFPPAILLQPRVADAELTLLDFRLRRISDADGPVVHELGRALKGVLDDEIAERRTRLIARLNRTIEKRQDKLRLSLSDLTGAGWREKLGL